MVPKAGSILIVFDEDENTRILFNGETDGNVLDLHRWLDRNFGWAVLRDLAEGPDSPGETGPTCLPGSVQNAPGPLPGSVIPELGREKNPFEG